MTISRLRAIPFLLALLAPAAWAQSDKPADEKPPVLTDADMPPVTDEEDKPAAPSDAPAKLEPDAATDPTAATAAPTKLEPDAATAPTAVTVAPADKNIEVGALGTTEGPAAGLLDPANGGLGDGIWNGSARADMEDLLTRVPLVSPDPAMRSLAKRIVLTKADTPLGSAKRAFIAIRIEKLLDAGLIDEAGALAAQASIPNDPDFARVQADALLVADRAADVCGDLTVTRLTAGEPFWLQLRAYCAAASGDNATADLTRAVIDAQGYTDNAYNTLVADVLNHKTTPPGPIVHPTAMHVFLLRQAGLPIPGEVAAAMGTPENLLAMRDTRNSPQLRIETADRIVRTGAASIAELKALAAAGDIPADRLATALADAPKLPFFLGQVLLRRAAQLETRPGAREVLVFTALSLGDKAGLLPLAAELQGDIAASIKPAPANRSMARLYARALLLAGLPDASARWLPNDDVWLTIADLYAPAPERDAKAQIALSAFAASLTADPPAPDPNASYKALVLGLTDALGRPLPPDAKAQVQSIAARNWDGKRPDADAMKRIEDVSLKPEQKGEALLLILDTIRSLGLRDLAPDVTIEFVRLLGAMGLPDAAHDFSLQALALYVAPPPPPPPPAAPAP